MRLQQQLLLLTARLHRGRVSSTWATYNQSAYRSNSELQSNHSHGIMGITHNLMHPDYLF